ncbi:ATP-binding protein [Thalassospiraceae bacterium LMO-JJ14]|nr:ATP-binding protein [Thalassospiraceae bacterium LMO-JJ14]
MVDKKIEGAADDTLHVKTGRHGFILWGIGLTGLAISTVLSAIAMNAVSHDHPETLQSHFTDPVNAPYITAALAFAIGLILTSMVFGYVLSLMNYERRVSELVQERTRALEESEQRLRDMADVSADWFWEMDSDLRFSYFSERFEQVTGLKKEDFLYKTREEAVGIIGIGNDESWRRHLQDIHEHRAFHDFRYSIKGRKGVEEYVSISGKPIFDKEGVFCGYRGTGRDVTDEEAAQRKLRESEARLHRNVDQLEMSRQDLEESTAKMAELAERYAIEKDRAEASERSKSEFLASMSHEIRTPMTGVMGFADMLLDSNLAPEDREKVIKIKGATQSLLTIINDILDLSKLDAGRLNIEFLDFNLKSTVEEILDLVRERARFKKLELNFDFGDGMAVGMHGDPMRFRQILINLVGNAVKFTHAGSVTIKARLFGDAPAQTVEFRVIDTGIGISQENCKKLFSDFSQADASISRHYEGTGLGLAISKRLVELMGGKIWVESEEGVGSSFCFTLPFHKAKSDVSKVSRHFVAEHFKTTRPLRILVAEDNKLNQRIIVATLDKFGHHSTVVEDGEQAVHQVDKAAYDLILMDIRMPEMSGPDATRVIRARHDHLAKIPIIALTADAMEEHIRGYLAAGMDDCVTKPIDRSALVETINKVLHEEIHVPLSEAEVARSGYALPTEDETPEIPTDDPAEIISVADFLKNLESVAEGIEHHKRADK